MGTHQSFQQKTPVGPAPSGGKPSVIPPPMATRHRVVPRQPPTAAPMRVSRMHTRVSRGQIRPYVENETKPCPEPSSPIGGHGHGRGRVTLGTGTARAREHLVNGTVAAPKVARAMSRVEILEGVAPAACEGDEVVGLERHRVTSGQGVINPVITTERATNPAAAAERAETRAVRPPEMPALMTNLRRHERITTRRNEHRHETDGSRGPKRERERVGKGASCNDHESHVVLLPMGGSTIPIGAVVPSPWSPTKKGDRFRSPLT